MSIIRKSEIVKYLPAMALELHKYLPVVDFRSKAVENVFLLCKYLRPCSLFLKTCVYCCVTSHF